MASIAINTKAWPVQDVLPILLLDRTTKKNIIFATESYADRGSDYGAKNQITEHLLSTNDGCIIQPRVLKDSDEQLLRTRRKAEVFTPAWVCCMMINHLDEDWFGRQDVFGVLDGQEWVPKEDPVPLPKRRRWQVYVDSRRLEITCGEAPYLVSRYDMATGEIIPIKDRIGILDRKLRIVNENAETEDEWLKWTLRAFQSVYGYEYQGDNLLVARINLLLSFVDYLDEKWNRKPTGKELNEIAKVISWNFWQMDGLKKSIPMGALYEQYHQMTIFDVFGMDKGTDQEESGEYIPCRIFDWRGQNKSVLFNAFREGRNGSMKFDYIIGNPPYQDERQGDSNTATPIYHSFMDAAYDISDKTMLITPARFLFNAGYTPKEWNKKMLNDEHLKVVSYSPDSAAVFHGVDIKGGVAVTYRDTKKNFGAIRIFTQYPEINQILHKVMDSAGFEGFNTIIVTSFAYHYTKALYEENPGLKGRASKGHDFDIQSNAFNVFPEVFFDSIPDDDDYIRILGRDGNTRCWKYIKRRYVTDVSNLDAYKAFLAKATGTGQFGETLPEAIMGNPGDGGTVTFLSIGGFTSMIEAENCVRYTKTKFARALLSVLKVTQDNTPGKWAYVPLQDFTSASDLDWSKSVAEIDRQLYAKYGLSDEEITFIETHVKEME